MIHDIDDSIDIELPKLEVVNEIAEELKNGDRLSSKNVLKILDMQKNDIDHKSIDDIDELKLIEDSGLEDYDD